MRDADGDGLRVEAGDLDVEAGIETVDKRGIVSCVVVCAEEIDHLGFREVGIGLFAEGVAESDESCAAGGFGEAGVALGAGVVEKRGDGVEFVKDAWWWLRAVVEHE